MFDCCRLGSGTKGRPELDAVDGRRDIAITWRVRNWNDTEQISIPAYGVAGDKKNVDCGVSAGS